MQLCLIAGTSAPPSGPREQIKAEAERAWATYFAQLDAGAVPQPTRVEMEAELPPGWWWSPVLPRVYPPAPLEEAPIGLIVEVVRATFPGPPGRHARSCKPGFRVVIGRRAASRSRSNWAATWTALERHDGVVLRGGFSTTSLNWRLMASGSGAHAGVMRRVAWVNFGGCEKRHTGDQRPTIDRDEMRQRVEQALGADWSDYITPPPRRWNQRHGRP